MAFNVPSHGFLDTGASQRFSPPVDSAKGMPRYAFTAFPSDVVTRLPQREPCFIFISPVEQGGFSNPEIFSYMGGAGGTWGDVFEDVLAFRSVQPEDNNKTKIITDTNIWAALKSLNIFPLAVLSNQSS